MSQVINIRRDKIPEENYVYIGRPSKWGNPYQLSTCPRSMAIYLYEEYLKSHPELLASLEELRGKTLGCYCKPLACHGDVLIRLLEEIK